jgi:hypothetical protein
MRISSMFSGEMNLKDEIIWLRLMQSCAEEREPVSESGKPVSQLLMHMNTAHPLHLKQSLWHGRHRHCQLHLLFWTCQANSETVTHRAAQWQDKMGLSQDKLIIPAYAEYPITAEVDWSSYGSHSLELNQTNCDQRCLTRAILVVGAQTSGAVHL